MGPTRRSLQRGEDILGGHEGLPSRGWNRKRDIVNTSTALTFAAICAMGTFSRPVAVGEDITNLSVYLALIHHPVIGKKGEVITSAVTNLDLHDIARAGRTFGVRAFYVATPLEDQKALAGRILKHWTEGYGGRYNPKRREALALIRIRDELDAVTADIQRREGRTPQVVATGARERNGYVGCAVVRERIAAGVPHLLVLGTAWGLAESVFQNADAVLEPIRGCGDYNHLSVRSAASILLDRLLGPTPPGTVSMQGTETEAID